MVRIVLLITLLVLPLPLAAEVTENLEYQDYLVSVAADESLLAALNRATPIRQGSQKYHGYTQWQVDWKFRWHFDGKSQCRMTSSTVTLQGSVLLPKLLQGTDQQRHDFEVFRRNLGIHELGHFEIGRKTAQAIDRHLQALPARQSCPELEQAANDGARKLLEKGMEEEREYDRRTGHGKTQGASLL